MPVLIFHSDPPLAFLSQSSLFHVIISMKSPQSSCNGSPGKKLKKNISISDPLSVISDHLVETGDSNYPNVPNNFNFCHQQRFGQKSRVCIAFRCQVKKCARNTETLPYFKTLFLTQPKYNRSRGSLNNWNKQAETTAPNKRQPNEPDGPSYTHNVLVN